MSDLRLDLIVRRYQKYGLDSGGIRFPDAVNAVDRWTWRLWSGSRVVSTSGAQLFSRRIDCARGAEVGAGVLRVVAAMQNGTPNAYRLDRYRRIHDVEVRILDERERVTA